jgi:Tol biopolymer transport system component
MTIAAGTKLGPYEILSPLGAGGMGEVYKARDSRLDRTVAIKVLSTGFAARPDRLHRFEQEARAAGQLNHPNITAVYDIGSTDGAPYVVQELLEGKTLRDTLTGGRLPPRKAVDYALQIANGLAAAHEKGIVHRDLKPENIFITRDGRAKILDFGLAKLTHPYEASSGPGAPGATATEPGVVLGTLGYMSPEQVSGEPADARSDIFSFGAILYEMLSGQRAFRGNSAADTMTAILTGDPPELSISNQSISPGLERIVRHCLEKNPEQRLHSAHDVAFALDAITGASAPSGVGALAPARRKRMAWVGLAAALAGAAILIAGGFVAGSRSSSVEPPTFRPVTFRRGLVSSARFAPDGQTVVYSASWEGGPDEIYQVRIGLPEPLPLNVPGGETIAGISNAGEMAVLLRGEPKRTLARVPMTGGAPREIAEDVAAADISRDGKAFAVVRRSGGVSRLEYPIGKTIHETSGGVSSPRISPDGRRVAFFDHPLVDDDRGRLSVIEQDGRKSALTSEWASVGGLAWSPSGDEIWFAAADHGANLAVRRVSLSRSQRRVLPGPGRFFVRDTSSDGRLLVEERTVRRALMCKPPGQEQERDLSWLDHSTVAAISRDSGLLLISETGEGGGEHHGIYVRKTDGSSAVRLGEGLTDNFSSDERWVTSLTAGADPKVVLLPVRAGEPRTLPDFGLRVRGAQLLPDGKRVVIAGARADGPLRMYVARIDDGAVREIGPEAIGAPGALSADGELLFAVDSDDKAFVYRIDGGEARAVAAYEAGQWPGGWSADGRFLYLFSPSEIPLRVWQVDLETGRREIWRVIAPAESAGTRGFDMFVVAADGRSYAYSYSRTASTLYVVEGAR